MRYTVYGLAGALNITAQELLAIRDEACLPTRLQKKPKLTREVCMALDRICERLEACDDGRTASLCISALKQYGGWGNAHDSSVTTDIDEALGA